MNSCTSLHVGWIVELNVPFKSMSRGMESTTLESMLMESMWKMRGI